MVKLCTEFFNKLSENKRKKKKNLISAGISMQDNPDSILKCDFWWKEMQGHVSAGLYIYALFFSLYSWANGMCDFKHLCCSPSGENPGLCASHSVAVVFAKSGS